MIEAGGRRVLVVFCGRERRTAADIISRLLGSKTAVRVCTDEGEEREDYPGGRGAAREATAGVSLVVIAGLPLYTLRKIALLDDGEPFAAVVIGALAAGIPVEMAAECLAASPSSPRGFKKAIEKLKNELYDLGIGLYGGMKTAASLPGARRIITADDIEAANGPVPLGPGDLLTPLAMDVLREMERKRGE